MVSGTQSCPLCHQAISRRDTKSSLGCCECPQEVRHARGAVKLRRAAVVVRACALLLRAPEASQPGCLRSAARQAWATATVALRAVARAAPQHLPAYLLQEEARIR